MFFLRIYDKIINHFLINCNLYFNSNALQFCYMRSLSFKNLYTIINSLLYQHFVFQAVVNVIPLDFNLPRII
jgi:hypothetical protein